MLSREHDQSLLNHATGPMCWSQTLSVANLGFILACLELHRSDELARLQNQVRQNIDYFDTKIPTDFAGNALPVRPVVIGNRDTAVALSRKLLNRGYYVSPVYFPVTSRGKEGLRVMIRGDVRHEQLDEFCSILATEIQGLRDHEAI